MSTQLGDKFDDEGLHISTAPGAGNMMIVVLESDYEIDKRKNSNSETCRRSSYPIGEECSLGGLATKERCRKCNKYKPR